MRTKSAIPEIIGTWLLESIYYINRQGKRIDLYGEHPRGILMYDKHGYMNAQLGQSDRTHLQQLSEESTGLKEQSFDTFMAYYGKFYEKEPGVIIHDVIGCMKPSWEGLQEIRIIDIQEDRLYITTPTMQLDGSETKIEVYWKRVI